MSSFCVAAADARVLEHLLRDVGAGHLHAREALRDDARAPAGAGREIEDALAGPGLQPLDGVLDGIRDAAADLVVATAG